jgi:hypothetical protein
MNGIISYLTRKNHRNVHDKGIVLMTAKSVGKGDVKNLVDVASDSKFRSKDEPNQWIRWEFRDSLVQPTHYTIRSSKGNYLKSWLVEGSMHGEGWTELDRRKNDRHLAWRFNIYSFDIE